MTCPTSRFQAVAKPGFTAWCPQASPAGLPALPSQVWDIYQRHRVNTKQWVLSRNI